MDTEIAPLPPLDLDDAENEDPDQHKPNRKNRLAALAKSINNWEDDLSHPTIRYTDVRVTVGNLIL